MHITDLVVRELGLTHVHELEPFATLNGVTVVDIESAEGYFRVHLVRDSEYLNVKLEEGSKLAAYYNSLFWHEISTAEKIPIPSAHFKTAFRINDGDVKHAAFVTKSESKGDSLTRLGLPELEQVAVQIAKLHAVNSRVVNEQFAINVEENYRNIKQFKRKMQKDLVEVLELALNSEVKRYFVNPSSILQKIGILTHHLENENTEEDEKNKHRVITHGRLTSDVCKFDENGKLVEISEWENIHLGNPVEDLSNLLVTSVDVEFRRKKFMKVFQVYFYALVDIHPPNYQLTELKRWFKEFEAKIVMDGIEQLLITLSENENEELKREMAYRWESALEDTVDFLTGNYISDDEHTFFSHKEDE
uniref:CHK domain-containing protein n=1 Tax=Caenorhabditis tropicalis TaxID=1561998 RepID=A0A1I7U7U4_9PELO